MRTPCSILVVLASGCGASKVTPAGPPAAPPAPAAAATWRVPDGWRSETIPFPLEFAPDLTHRGAEELRFPPGFFDPASPEYWSYAFAWRLEDAAMLDGTAMAGELTGYFRGLIAAVDEAKKITARDDIVATAVDTAHVQRESGGLELALTAHVFDAFKTGQPLDLGGTARRTSCPGGGALWVFVLTPNPDQRATLDALAAEATCAQTAVPNKPRP